ncbi:MAG: agmatine deiminase family protein, partial [Bacillota bacterium]|nr:agmatine deiminase family protein [Bacillota bacterium]
MSVKLTSFPAEDGFRMPGEFEPHHGCIMIWPERPGSWNYGAVNARKAFCEIAKAISESEKVYMLVSDSSVDSARAMLPSNITLQFIASNDAWARDTAPTFVCGADGSVRAVDWQFNAWGGKYDGLYSHWEKDDALAKEFCIKNGYDFYDAHPFVLEGGAIHSDGQGTLITTESCLLSRGRNPKLSKCLIEDTLKKYLNVKKIIWLP